MADPGHEGTGRSERRSGRRTRRDLRQPAQQHWQLAMTAFTLQVAIFIDA